MYYALPTSSYGYYRGAPQVGGGAYGGGGTGPVMAGNGVFAQGQGPQSQTGWSPTILYMVGLIIGEMIVFGILSRKL